jgi:predicted regulator of Ras-like GTPase activity (Roadblock/LC7/MglB family)
MQRADETSVTEIEPAMGQLIDHVVDHVPGVSGAIISSADGFVLASRLPASASIDPSAVAAMSAAILGLSDRLVRLTGAAPAASSHQRSDDGQVFVFGISRIAVLTILTGPGADAPQIQAIGHEVGAGLQRLFRDTAHV